MVTTPATPGFTPDGTVQFKDGATNFVSGHARSRRQYLRRRSRRPR
jgi:hypothetical protein